MDFAYLFAFAYLSAFQQFFTVALPPVYINIEGHIQKDTSIQGTKQFNDVNRVRWPAQSQMYVVSNLNQTNSQNPGKHEECNGALQGDNRHIKTVGLWYYFQQGYCIGFHYIVRCSWSIVHSHIDLSLRIIPYSLILLSKEHWSTVTKLVSCLIFIAGTIFILQAIWAWFMEY